MDLELSSEVILGSEGVGCVGLLLPLTTWRARRGRGLRLRRLDTQAGELGSRESVEEEEDRGMEAEGGTTQEEEDKVELAAEVVVVVIVEVVVAEVCSGFEEEEGGGLEDSTLWRERDKERDNTVGMDHRRLESNDVLCV